jgi:hypothetical protein
MKIDIGGGLRYEFMSTISVCEYLRIFIIS